MIWNDPSLRLYVPRNVLSTLMLHRATGSRLALSSTIPEMTEVCPEREDPVSKSAAHSAIRRRVISTNDPAGRLFWEANGNGKSVRGICEQSFASIAIHKDLDLSRKKNRGELFRNKNVQSISTEAGIATAFGVDGVILVQSKE